MESVGYREFGVGPLAGYAECFWTVELGNPAPDYPVLPDGCMDIVFWPEGGLRAVGAMTTRQVSALAPGTTITGVRFLPGMSDPFLAGVARELVDRWTPLEDLWGARASTAFDRLCDAASTPERLRLLASILPRPSASPDPVQRAIAVMVAAHGSIDLDGLADQAGLSPRQFRRRSIEATGLSPKHLCRVLRFRRAGELAPPPGSTGWARVAAECGYSDQAHLIHDFREFAGTSPSDFSRDRFFQDTGQLPG